MSMELGLTGYVDFKGRIYDREKIKKYLWFADIGVEPAPCNTANEHSTFIKVMEFMAAGIPMVAFDSKETRYSADGAALLVQPGDIKGYSVALKHLINNPEMRQQMGQAGFKRVKEELNWEKAAKNLKNAYESLV
jgi:glycosyltransferase involved in cell wall biosynthesis